MKRRVLAIGLDAADSKLIRQLIDEGEMPCLQSLLRDGLWIRVDSTADVGSSSVWPTFTTAQNPEVHGIYSEWCWEPARMGLSMLTGRELTPFWKTLSDNGQVVGVLGVPFMPLVGLRTGFEVSERRPYLASGHDRLVSVGQARHALSHGMVKVAAPDDRRNLERLAADSLEGIKLRGQLAQRLIRARQPDVSIVVFTEIHEVSHCLWQTVEPQHPLFKEDFLKQLAGVRPTLREIFREVDRQVERLVQAAGTGTSVLVFSLHGMTPGRGAPTFLSPLMCEAGFAKLADVNGQRWGSGLLHSIRTLKKRTPSGLKKIYYRALPRETVMRLAAPTLLPPYAWKQTRAFGIVEEHLSSIRVNLAGREAEGIVNVADYESVCRETEDWLKGLRSADGLPLARKIIRTSTNAGEALNRRLPDIVVHWQDAAFASPLRIAGDKRAFYRDGERHLSQHTSEGFCILHRDSGLRADRSIQLKDVSALIKTLAAA
jgi:predicted AlkP superfamily phosphohydrolase/phosphomutase